MLWPLETPLLGFAELPPLNVRGLGVPQSHQHPPPNHHHFYISNIFYHRRIGSLVKLSHITFNKIWHGQFRRNYCFKYLAVSHNGPVILQMKAQVFQSHVKSTLDRIDSLTLRELIISNCVLWALWSHHFGKRPSMSKQPGHKKSFKRFKKLVRLTQCFPKIMYFG